MKNSSIRRQWLDSYQSHLLEEEHSPQTIRKYIHDIAFFFSFLPAEAEISKEKVLAYKQELIQKYRPGQRQQHAGGLERLSQLYRTRAVPCQII